MFPSEDCVDLTFEQDDDPSISIDSLERKIRENKQLILRLEAENAILRDQIAAIKSQEIDAEISRGIQESAQPVWKNSLFSWSSQVQNALQNIFGLKEWRSPQLEIVNAVKSLRDVLVVMPAGAGKSLTFQIPAIVETGKLTLVVSPLIALMVDQVAQLKAKEIGAEIVSSFNDSGDEMNRVFEKMQNDQGICLVYITPEKLVQSKRVRALLGKLYAAGRISRFVIDEAHCCSQWGHDFRTDYRKLGFLRNVYPDIPIFALTATAPHSVRKDLVELLGMNNPVLFFKSTERKNLIYSVVQKMNGKESIHQMGKLIQEKYLSQSGLIYCLQRKEAEEISDLLSREYNINSAAYHSDMSNDAKMQIYNLWSSNQISVIVATIAFGMGINKENVRFVIHHTPSKSLSAYYQESGRAGRDGKESDCIILYSPYDIPRLAAMTYTEINGYQHLMSIAKYCQTRLICRQKILADHFDESSETDKCGKCDICSNDKELIEMNCNDVCIALLKQIIDSDSKKTMIQLEKEWPASGSSNLKGISKHDRGKLIIELVMNNFLEFSYVENVYSTNVYIQCSKRTKSDSVENIFTKPITLHTNQASVKKRKAS
jgi:ATP-dependent DNA helicase Q1